MNKLITKVHLLKNAVMCRFFHPIETLENCSFVDDNSCIVLFKILFFIQHLLLLNPLKQGFLV